MPIFNKDGSIFRLAGVNPLLAGQNRWVGRVIRFVCEEVLLPDPKIIVEEEEQPVMVGVGTVSEREKEVVYCMAPIYEEDFLYGSKKRVGWDERFNFEAYVETNGVSCVIFATVPVDKVLPGSIVYVLRERLWWLIDSVEEGDGGVHIRCVPSGVQPAFS